MLRLLSVSDHNVLPVRVYYDSMANECEYFFGKWLFVSHLSNLMISIGVILLPQNNSSAAIASFSSRNQEVFVYCLGYLNIFNALVLVVNRFW